MLDTGAPHELPYPEAATDPPNGPAQIQALAEQVAERLGGRAYAEVLTSQTTATGGPADLATVGPSVALTVPASGGIVAIRAEVTLSVPSGTAVVFLDEDGVSLGQILSNTTPAATKYTCPEVNGGGSASGTPLRVYGGWLVFSAAAGARTYKLRYGSPGLGTATFVNRKLWGLVIPF